MKRSLLTILALSICLLSSAQAKVQTKQYILSDFQEKTMKVVLTEDEMLDAALRESMQQTWHFSPYEFCSPQEFEQVKALEDYYFLTLTDTKFGSEPQAGIRSFVVFKGKEGAKEGLDGLYKVVGIPFCGAAEISPAQISVLPVYICVLQDEIQKITKRAINLGNGVQVAPDLFKGKWDKTILVQKEDLSFDLGFSMEETYKRENILFVDQQEIDDAIQQGREKTLVAYVVKSANDGKSAVSYTLLFNTEDHSLVYLNRHKVNEKAPMGLLQSELRYFISRN